MSESVSSYGCCSHETGGYSIRHTEHGHWNPPNSPPLPPYPGHASEHTPLLISATLLPGHDRHPDHFPSVIKERRGRQFSIGLTVVRFVLVGLFVFTLGYFGSEVWRKMGHVAEKKDWEAEREHHALLRRQWIEEAHEHKADHNNIIREREEWAQERAQWHADDMKRKEIERQRQQEIDRQKALATWEDLRPGACLQYGHREYTARLAHVSRILDPMEECRTRPTTVRDEMRLPDRCTVVDQACSDPIGHWVVSKNEVGCMPTWKKTERKECVRQGTRRWYTETSDIKNGDTNWEQVCRTTPAILDGSWWPAPVSCEAFWWGVAAHYETYDEGCH